MCRLRAWARPGRRISMAPDTENFVSERLRDTSRPVWAQFLSPLYDTARSSTRPYDSVRRRRYLSCSFPSATFPTEQSLYPDMRSFAPVFARFWLEHQAVAGSAILLWPFSSRPQYSWPKVLQSKLQQHQNSGKPRVQTGAGLSRLKKKSERCSARFTNRRVRFSCA
jgi:hypothetical protein